MNPIASERAHNSDNQFFSDFRFRSVLDSLSLPVLLIDLSGKILYANIQAINEFLKIIADHDHQVDNVQDLFSYPEREYFMLDIKKVCQGEMVTTMFSFSDRFGNENWFKFTMNPVRDEKDDAARISVIIQNITSKETKANSSAPGDSRYKEILQEQTDLICRFYPDGVISFVNDAYCRYFGKLEKELLGSNLFELIPDGERIRALKKIKELSPEAPFYHYDQQVVDANQKERWLNCTDRGIFECTGTLNAILPNKNNLR